MATIDKALQIAAKAHDGQKDRSGNPYILHPLRVMQNVDGDDAQIVAILHDVVEDTDVTLHDLRQAGFNQAVIDGVAAMTHDDDKEPFADYVVRCKANAIGRQVKLADLRDNSQLSRLLMRPEEVQKDVARVQKYVLAYRFLTDEIDQQQYRRLMSDWGIS